MSEEAEVSRKVGRAFQMLVLQKHRYPGVKGWELKKVLGSDYNRYLEILDAEISRLGLAVKTVFDDAEEGKPETESEKMDRARYFVVFRDSATAGDAGTLGLRIDELAVLAASIAYITPRQGGVRRRELEQMLREKFPKWKVQLNLDRFVRKGYLMENDDMLQVGWRTRAEIDRQTLLSLILAEGSQ